MSYVKPDDWQPSPGITVEGNALDIVKSEVSISVLAGPGSGKTELLAQRAMYLLTTGLCPAPRRILAIAFKVDAARNLGQRVADRCEPAQASRFESLTFDAFAMRMVDQFLEAIPEQWRPSPDYKMIFTNANTWNEFRNKHGGDYPFVHGFQNAALERLVHQSVPEFELEEATTPEQQIQWLWWRGNIDARPSLLTYDMIKVLAAYILSTHNTILSALQQTYSHVFLDEFQDVTGYQFDLIKAAFLNSKAILTAVGDSNQGIMRWAGALPDIYEQFHEGFAATNHRLQFNFRSNSRIVTLINDLTATFDDDFVPTECARLNAPVPDNAVEGWVFDTRQIEGEFFASYIEEELRNNHSLRPEDFVILARLRVNDVEDRIETSFNNHGLKVRNEARLVGDVAIQDLVKEKIYSFFMACLKLSVNVRVGQPFQDCRDTIADVRGADIRSDKGQSETLNAVRALIDELQQHIDGRQPSEVDIDEITTLILKHVGLVEMQRTYKEYNNEARLISAIDGYIEFFNECRENTESWAECIANMEGENAVRLMTIHKCKGLEYHTVIFSEFNDDAFWGNEDDINVFFVALSRARERVYFSFTKDSRGFANVRDLYDKLQAANVPFLEK